MKKLETTLAILSIAISIAAIIISHHANKICKEAEQLQKINAAAMPNAAGEPQPTCDSRKPETL